MVSHENAQVFVNYEIYIVAKNFVSNQCFIDVHISCHLLIFLVVHLRNKYPG